VGNWLGKTEREERSVKEQGKIGEGGEVGLLSRKREVKKAAAKSQVSKLSRLPRGAYRCMGKGSGSGIGGRGGSLRCLQRKDYPGEIGGKLPDLPMVFLRK